MKRIAAILLSAAGIGLLGIVGAAPAQATELREPGTYEPKQGYYRIAHNWTWVYRTNNYNEPMYQVHRDHLVYVYCWDPAYNLNRVYVQGHTQGWIVRHNIQGEPTRPFC